MIMVKRFVSLLGIATLLLGSTTTAFADDVVIDGSSGYSGSAVVESNLVVSNKIEDLPLIGGELVVEIPSSLGLEYDRKTFKHTCETEVGVRGELNEFAMVYVTVPEEVVFFQEDDASVTMLSEVEFQLDSNTEGYVLATWTSAEAAEGKDNASLTNTKDLKIVANGLGAVSGDYEAEVIFDITVDYFGMYDAVAGGKVTNGDEVFKLRSTNSNATSTPYAISFIDSKAEALNIYEYIDLSKVELASTFKGYAGSADVSTLTTPNTTVKYIKLGTGMTYYCTSRSKDITQIQSWCMGLDALEVIYVPQAFSSGSNISKLFYTRNYVKATDVYSGTEILCGNALVFCKGINEDGECVYVPNIVFGGTMDEWISIAASSGTNATDWVFGNSANDVTVHCSDGTLLY